MARENGIQGKRRFVFPVLAEHRWLAAGVEYELTVDPVFGDREEGVGEVEDVHRLLVITLPDFVGAEIIVQRVKKKIA